MPDTLSASNPAKARPETAEETAARIMRNEKRMVLASLVAAYRINPDGEITARGVKKLSYEEIPVESFLEEFRADGLVRAEGRDGHNERYYRITEKGIVKLDELTRT